MANIDQRRAQFVYKAEDQLIEMIHLSVEYPQQDEITFAVLTVHGQLSDSDLARISRQLLDYTEEYTTSDDEASFWKISHQFGKDAAAKLVSELYYMGKMPVDQAEKAFADLAVPENMRRINFKNKIVPRYINDVLKGLNGNFERE